MADFKTDHPMPENIVKASKIETYKENFRTAYGVWKQKLIDDVKKPNRQQWSVLDLIHDRCVYEYWEERNHCINETRGSAHWEPLFRLIHGLPGSGKSQLLKWIRNYFEAVWSWEHGVHFIFLAPLNSMATDISGQTLHSWGGINFKKSSGLSVGSGILRKDKDNVEQMHVSAFN